MFQKMKDRIANWMQPKNTYISTSLFPLLFGTPETLPTTEEVEFACDLELEKRPIQVAIFRIGEAFCDPSQLNMIMTACTSTSDSDEVRPVTDGCNQVAFLFFRDVLWEDQVKEILEDTQKEFMANWPNANLCITLGTMEEYAEDGEPAWRRSYKAAFGLQDYRYVKPKNKLISYAEIIARRQMYPEGMAFRFDLLKTHLENDTPELLESWLDGIFAMVSGDDKKAFGLRYHLTLEIVVNTISLIREQDMLEAAHLSTPEAFVDQVLNLNTSIAMQTWTLSFLEDCRAIIQSKIAK